MAVSLPLMRLFVVHVRYVLQVLSHARMMQGRGSAVRVPEGSGHMTSSHSLKLSLQRHHHTPGSSVLQEDHTRQAGAGVPHTHVKLLEQLTTGGNGSPVAGSVPGDRHSFWQLLLG